jgi:hypothetical protein|eukprot:COSAG02_NODE_328_length_24547_cov_4.124141_26_plen_75_part_00
MANDDPSTETRSSATVAECRALAPPTVWAVRAALLLVLLGVSESTVFAPVPSPRESTSLGTTALLEHNNQMTHS